MSLGAEVCECVEALAGLQVREREPGCWLLSSSVHPLSDDERKGLLALLAEKSSAIAAGMDHPDRHIDRIDWHLLSGDADTWQLPSEGEWLLVCWASSTPVLDKLPDGVRDDCQVLKDVLLTNHADVLILSQPDDLEWTVVVRSDLFPSTAFRRHESNSTHTPNDFAYSRRLTLAVLAILGLGLLIVGWFRWFTP